jgi:hypothetical protein
VIRYGNTLPKWIADTSKKNSPQNPIIHRANPILQLARRDQNFKLRRYPVRQANGVRLARRGLDAVASTVVESDGLYAVERWTTQAKHLMEPCPPENNTRAPARFI